MSFNFAGHDDPSVSMCLIEGPFTIDSQWTILKTEFGPISFPLLLEPNVVEEWKEVPGHSGYRVSPNGDIWSAYKNGLLKVFYGWLYPTIKLKADNGTHSLFYVHTLVAQLYVPNPNNYEEVNHLDCNRRNFTSTNLQWVSPKMNMAHAVAMGVVRSGEQKASKLTFEDVKSIFKSKKSCRVLAKVYDVSPTLISRIRTRKCWTGVTKRKPNSKYEFNGEKLTLNQIAKKLNLRTELLRDRLARGLSQSTAFTSFN